MLSNIIPDAAAWRIAGLLGTLSAALLLCGYLVALIRSDRLPVGWTARPEAIIKYAGSVDATKVLTVVHPIVRNLGTEPQGGPLGRAGERVTGDPRRVTAAIDTGFIPKYGPAAMPLGLVPDECWEDTETRLTDGTVAVAHVAEPLYVGRHHEDTVGAVRPGWRPETAPEPELVRPYAMTDQAAAAGGAR